MASDYLLEAFRRRRYENDQESAAYKRTESNYRKIVIVFTPYFLIRY